MKITEDNYNFSVPQIFRGPIVWRRPHNSFLKTRLRCVLKSNLTCFQLVLSGFTIGKYFREKMAIQSEFYNYFYQGIIYINFFWLFYCFKHVLTFFNKLGYRQHVFLGGGTFDINKNDVTDRENSLHVNFLKIEELLETKKYVKTAWLEGVYFIANRIWIKGLLSNKHLTNLQLTLRSKIYLKRPRRSLALFFPTAAFFVSRYKTEIGGLVTEVNNTNIPSVIAFDTNVNIKGYKFLYFLPANTRSFNLFLTIGGLCLYTKLHNYLIRSKFLYPLLDSNQYLYKKNRF